MSEAIKPVWSAGFKTVTVQETEEHVLRIFESSVGIQTSQSAYRV